MDVRAAIAVEAGKPLVVDKVQLDGPKAGEVLVEIKATGICHTDKYTLSGADPEGLFPSILGHEGAGVVVEVGAGVKIAQGGRSRHSALYPRMPRVQVLHQPQDQPLHADSRHAGQGPDARRHQPLLVQGQAGAALHGLLDVRQLHGAAGNSARQGARGRAVRQDLLHRLRRHHRHRRGDLDRQGRTGRQRRGLRPRRHWPERHPGREDGGRQTRSSAWI